MKSLIRFTLPLAFALALINFAGAQQASKPTPTPPEKNEKQADHPRREPPPQAYDACKAKKLGDSIEITTPRGDKIKATCSESPKGLFARPEHPPEHRADGPGEGRGKEESKPRMQKP